MCVWGGGVAAQTCLFFCGLPGGRTPTGWPHTEQSGKPNCQGPEAKPHPQEIRLTPLSQEVPSACTKIVYFLIMWLVVSLLATRYLPVVPCEAFLLCRQAAHLLVVAVTAIAGLFA